MLERANPSVPIEVAASHKNLLIFRFLQCLILFSGIISIVWAFSASQFRDAEGFLKGTFCLPVSVGVALMVLGCATAGRWKRCALWFALAVVGQAVSLQMIDAGPLIHYQHYKSLNQLLKGTGPLLVLFLGIQVAFVTAGVGKRWPSIGAWIGSTFKTWQLLGAGLIFVLSSAALSRELSVYVAELLFAALVQVVNLGNILLMVWAIPQDALPGIKRALERFFGQGIDQDQGSRVEDHESKIQNCSVDRFAVVAAIWIVALAAVLSYFVYERHPHVPDEVVYLYHARYLADGVLTMSAPPVPDAFGIYLMELEGDRWYPSPPPGWPVMLGVGVLFGAPWLINPLLAGVNTLLAYLLLVTFYGRRTARICVFLLCISPWHVFMAMNFMTHTFTLTCALAAAVAIIWARQTGNLRWGCVGGILTGIMGLIRPLEGVLWAGLLGLWSVGIGGRRLKMASILALGLGVATIGALILLYNNALTGSATVFPIMAYTDKHFGINSNAFGFGPDRGMGWALDPYPGHGLLDAFVNANLNMFSLNVELFGWSTGSLVIGAVMLFSGTMRKNDYLMVAVIVTVFIAHIFYWYSGGPDFGARYWYLMLIPCVALTVRGIEFIETLFPSVTMTSSMEKGCVLLAVMSLSLMTVVNYFPWRAIDKYHHYLGMRPDIRYLAEKHHFGKSLVLVRGEVHPDFASAFAYNPVDLSGDVPIYAWDRNPELRVKLFAAYPNRPVWIVNGPSITGNGYKVIAGPLLRDHR